jgi:hypothetical protein
MERSTRIPAVGATPEEVTVTPPKSRRGGPVRRCAFCGLSGGMTKEHVWPQWLRQLAGELEPVRFAHTAGFERSAADAFREMPTVTVQQPGSVLNLVARAVCARCNSGWMSRLEERARPLLLGLAEAACTGALYVLTPDQAAAVAAWAVKTAWMREFTSPSRSSTAKMRHSLYQRLLPPEFSMVWAARHVGELDFDILQAVVSIARYDRRWDDGNTRRAQWTCLTFRGIALLVYTVDGWGVPPPQRNPALWVPLWPSVAAVRFPPPTTIDDSGVKTAVARHTPWLQFPDVPRFERDGQGPQFIRRN